MSDAAIGLSIAAIVVVIVALFFLLRRVVWWYFGIDRALDTLERIDRRLAHILEIQLTPPAP